MVSCHVCPGLQGLEYASDHDCGGTDPHAMCMGIVTLKHRVEARLDMQHLIGVLQNQPMAMVGESEELTDGLRTQVLFAREYLKDVTIGEKQVERLVQEAARGGCQGHRAELFAARVAKASAALDVRALHCSEHCAKGMEAVPVCPGRSKSSSVPFGVQRRSQCTMRVAGSQSGLC